MQSINRSENGLRSAFRLGITRHFFIGAACLALVAAYFTPWSMVAQWLTGDAFYGIGTPIEIFMALRQGGIMALLLLVSMTWLAITGFLARGAALKQRDRRIAELESALKEKNAN